MARKRRNRSNRGTIVVWLFRHWFLLPVAVLTWAVLATANHVDSFRFPQVETSVKSGYQPSYTERPSLLTHCRYAEGEKLADKLSTFATSDLKELDAHMHRAGGMTGLVSESTPTNSAAKTYWAVNDHNGNVVGLVDADDQSVAAAYEYSPFGEVLTADGSYAAENPIRFSSKYYDKEVGLYYFGYRYYDPANGRWLNRDPIAEDGGLNLYGFVGNDPINEIDPDGHQKFNVGPPQRTWPVWGGGGNFGYGGGGGKIAPRLRPYSPGTAGSRPASGSTGTRPSRLANEPSTRSHTGSSTSVTDSRSNVSITKSGETKATATGKDVHAELATSRRTSGQFDLVQSAIKAKDGNMIQVPKRVDLKSGKPQLGAKLQEAVPDAVSFRRKLIIDDKPLGRPLAKDRQEIIRFIKAYEVREGHLPDTIAIQRYDPVTGRPVVSELYSPSDFLP